MYNGLDSNPKVDPFLQDSRAAESLRLRTCPLLPETWADLIQIHIKLPTNVRCQFVGRPIWERLFEKLQESRHAGTEEPPGWVEGPQRDL